jgi:hypothetical protein
VPNPRTDKSRANETTENEQNTKSSVYLAASFLAISLFRFCLAIATLNRPKSDREARSFFDFSFVPHDVASNCDWMSVSSSSSFFFL